MGNEQHKTDYGTLTIGKCFGNNYVVPAYQREYVWEEANVEQLLADLIAAYGRDAQKPYFMGMMVVCAGKSSSLELVDGQQRITTFFILLSAFSHLCREENDHKTAEFYERAIYRPKLGKDGNVNDGYALELQYEMSSDRLNKIFHKDIPNAVEIEQCTMSDQRLYRAYTAIIKILRREFKEFSELKMFAGYVFDKVELAQIQTTDISDALKIFETINERGVGLSPMDLLKNMLFMNVEKNKFADLNREWKNLVTRLEGVNESPLRFLRYFISATYDVIDPNSSTRGILPEDGIYDWLVHNDDQCKYSKDPFAFVALLNKSADRYVSFLRPNSTDPGDEYLKNIPRIAGNPYRLHIVLLMAATQMEENVLGRFKRVLESVVYYTVVNSIKANEIEKIFAAWCPKIRKVKTLGELKEFVRDTVVPQLDKWKIDNKQHFMTISLSTMQQYRVKYILTRIIKYVDDVRAGGTQYADLDPYYDKKTQIEHIMPQTCADPSAYGVLSEEFDAYVGRLGNLTLLEKAYNAICQNKPYIEKTPTYQKSQFYLTKALPTLEDAGIQTAANKMNALLSTWSTWNKAAIEQRQEMLFELSEKIWPIESYIDTWK